MIFSCRSGRSRRSGSPAAPAVEKGERAVSYLLGQGKFENRKDYPLPSVILLDWNMPR